MDRHIFCIRIARQNCKNTSKYATFAPATQALVRRLPIAVALWQVTPRNAGSRPINNSIDEQTIVDCRAANVPLPTWQKIFDLDPLVVAQGVALHVSTSVSNTAI